MLETMIANMPEKTGKSLEEWFETLDQNPFEKHGEGMKFLKGEHGVTHGFANTILQLYKQRDASQAEPDLIADQYEKKAELKPIHDKLKDIMMAFGNDVEWAAKKTYVSVRRNKQFAIVQPSTKTRLDLGINLKGKAPEGKLEASGSFNSMVSHRIKLSHADEIDDAVIGWLKEAYELA
jgi:predicted transport protein